MDRNATRHIVSWAAVRLVGAAALCGICISNPARAVILSSGNGNLDGTSLTAAGGPGGLSEPGWGNVGRSSTGNASVTYLDDRWVLTAGHVSISTTVSFGGTSYTVEGGTTTFLHNPDNSLTDLKLFRITSDPGLPAITAQLLSSLTPTGRQIMIGNGLSIGSQHFWHDDLTTDPWPNDATPGTVDADDYSGFDVGTPRKIRWGENDVAATGLVVTTVSVVHAFATLFDDAAYTGTTPLASEAQASSGDSGGAVFGFVGGEWKLTGIILAVNNPLDRQPSSTAVFGDVTFIADLSVYRDEILTIVPEPGGLAAAAIGAVLLGLWGLIAASRRQSTGAAEPQGT